MIDMENEVTMRPEGHKSDYYQMIFKKNRASPCSPTLK